MALIKEVWVKDIQETLEQNADFLPYSVDHSAYVAFGTVHLPQSGAAASVVVNPTSLPLTIAQRTDTDRTYSMAQYAFETPILITNIDELQVSYLKRQSVIGQQINTLTQTIGNYVATSWTPNGNDNIILTTGTTGANALPPSGTGTRKDPAIVDIANLAKKLDKDNVPSKGRKLLMNSDMFWQLFSISEVVRASYNGFAQNALGTGVIAQLMGFDILVRPTVSVFTKTGTTAKAVGTAAAADDRLACIAWHPNFVSRALGSMTPMYNAGSNGNGLPEYLGSIFNMEVMLGSAILRTDLKGTAALVQTWVS